MSSELEINMDEQSNYDSRETEEVLEKALGKLKRQHPEERTGVFDSPVEKSPVFGKKSQLF